MNSIRLSKRATTLALASIFGIGAAVLSSTPAHASDSVSVTVNATIIGVCKFFTASPVINITNTGSGSNIDPSLAGPASGSVDVTYRCSNGTSPSFTVPASATVTCTTAGTCGATSMAPTVTSSNTGAGTGLGSGKDQTLTVTGQITQANYQNMQVGSYSGSMTVSVTP
jgi:hypothetical protein